MQTELQKHIAKVCHPELHPESVQGTLKISHQKRCELAKSLFWRMANKIAQKELKPEFVIDEENKLVVSAFVAYFTNDIDTMQQLDINPRKGILLIGNPGSGKSMLFRVVKACLQNDEYRPYFKYFRFENTDTPGKLYMKEGDSAIDKYTKLKVKSIQSNEILNDICFDDLGAEEMRNSYGNKREVMADIILERYNHFNEHGLVTHFTSNLDPEELESRYSTRIRSRLKHMCNLLVLGGSKEYKDRR